MIDDTCQLINAAPTVTTLILPIDKHCHILNGIGATAALPFFVNDREIILGTHGWARTVNRNQSGGGNSGNGPTLRA